MQIEERLIAQTKPLVDVQANRDANADAVRYGFLVGGFPRLDLSGNYIGDWSVGHMEILRRELVPFTEQYVGSRAETQEAIDQRLSVDAMGANSVGGIFLGAAPPPFVRRKSPKECAYAVAVTYGISGFVVLEPLTGLAKPIEIGNEKSYDHEDALIVYKAITRRPTGDGEATHSFEDLIDFRDHLQYGENFIEVFQMSKDMTRRAYETKDVLLDKANSTYTTIFQTVTQLESELSAFKLGHGGKAGLNEVERELFREIRRPIPSDAPVVPVGTSDDVAKAMLAIAQQQADTTAEFQRLLLAQQNEIASLKAKGE